MQPSTNRLRGARSLALLAFTAVLGTAVPARAQPAVTGEWGPVTPWPDTGTHLALVPGGRVLSWAEIDPAVFSLWDPVSNTHTATAHPGYNAFCSGFSLMADGRLLMAGGHIDDNRGLPNASLYDWKTGTWAKLPNMNAGRWYPTTVALPSGEMLVIAGSVTARRIGENRLPQVWQPATNSWRNLTGAMRTVEQYPWMFVTPSGKVFLAGPGKFSALLDTTGAGAWTEVQPSQMEYRRWGSAVMYDDGKVMISGGGDVGNTNLVELIDLNGPTPTWRSGTPMARARKQHNTTLLPDGTVLVTGGTSGPGKDDEGSAVLATELWDPATEKFTTLAPSKVYRGYHSSALLLPDGRVLSVGGQGTRNAELFSPPYLFKGPRPGVTSSPAAVRYGETFTVPTPDAASIAKVTLLRPGAVTHAFNQGQHINRLAFTKGAGVLNITAPNNSNLAPPGSYMLFLVNEQGVPSVARWVSVGGPDAKPPGQVPALATGTAWKYDDSGRGPGAAWLSRDFDDSGWKSGRSGFDSTAQGSGTQLQLKADVPTAYFRKRFLLRGTVTGGQLQVKAADGVAVWINGTRVLARNVGEGTDPASYATAAAAADTPIEVPLPVGVLVDGENQVAVMVKQARPTADRPAPALRFDLGLTATTHGQVEPVPVLALQTPNGGETLAGGATVKVAWSTDGTLPAVTLEYSVDGGGRWEPIEAAAPNTGSYDWRVPSLESGQVLLRVSGADVRASGDTSDAPFTIHASLRVDDGPGMGCDPACASGEACVEQGGQHVCEAQDPSEPPEPKTGCTSGGTAPSALVLLLALDWLRRRGRAHARRRPGQDPAA